MVAGASGAVDALAGMGVEMTDAMLPGLGQMLGMTPDQVQAFIEGEFPVAAGAVTLVAGLWALLPPAVAPVVSPVEEEPRVPVGV
jgi:hypothetical protein